MTFFNSLRTWLTTPSTVVSPSTGSLLATTLAMIDQAATLRVAGEYQAALSMCNQILTLDPINSTAYRIRGLVKIRLNDRQGGENDLHTAQSLHNQTQD